jgi:hypothetical protein
MSAYQYINKPFARLSLTQHNLADMASSFILSVVVVMIAVAITTICHGHHDRLCCFGFVCVCHGYDHGHGHHDHVDFCDDDEDDDDDDENFYGWHEAHAHRHPTRVASWVRQQHFGPIPTK